MTCPYKKPSYLSEKDARNCYATNRGWVVLKPNGKYDIIENIGNLDGKIQAWYEANGKSEFKQEPIPEELKPAMTNLTRVKELEAAIKEVRAQIEEIEKEIPQIDKKEIREEQIKVPADAFKAPKKARRGDAK